MRAGDLIEDRFEIERLAGRGGMGAVYRARDRRSGALVALKVMLGSERDAARFLREAQVLASLQHPAIVGFVADGRTAEGTRWLAMEWLDGEDLGTRLRRGALGMTDAVALARRLAEALAAAHARGVIHRDLKPQNVFLPGGDLRAAKLLDFGIARLPARAAFTGTGMLVGTPGYMAPEQARGEKHLDARADVYALGCVLFECVAGRPAFVGENVMAVLARILLERTPRLAAYAPAAPAWLDELAARLMAHEPAARPPDMRAVIEALDAATASAAIGAGTPGAPEAPDARDAARPALGAREQHLVCVLAVAPDAALALAATGAALTPPAARGREPGDAGDAALAHTQTPEQGGPGAAAAVAAAARSLGGGNGSGSDLRLETLADGSRIGALWGAGTAAEHALRLAHAAVALTLAGDAGAPPPVMAIATGSAVVGGTVPLGEVLDRAARLVAAGVPGVALDDTTAGLLEARFTVLRDGAHARLGAARAAVDEQRLLLGRATRFVGRARELDQLLALYDGCVDEPAARAVVVSAPAGVGKSRLRQELGRRLAARDAPPRLGVGRGDPMTAGSPLGILVGALADALGLDGADGAAGTAGAAGRRARLADVLAADLPADTRGHGLDFLGELLGAPAATPSAHVLAARKDPILMGDQTRRAFEEWVLGVTARRSLVLVLEDLHWGDAATLRFVDAALRVARDRPFFVAAFARPEVFDTLGRLWPGRGCSELALAELGKRAAGDLVRDALGDRADAALVGELVERAAGNAFFLEELIRAVADAPVAAAGVAAATALPGSVLAMARQRVEGLDADARQLLRAASVFGERFGAAGVATLLGAPAVDPVRRRLERLVDAELLVRRPDGGDDAELAFRHSLLREGAYAMLTDDDRRLGHRLAAEWLAARGGDPLAVAEHFERGGEPRRAAHAYRHAAAAALEANDFAAALVRARRGVALGADGDDRVALRMTELDAQVWSGGRYDTRELAGALVAELAPGSAPWCQAMGLIAFSSMSPVTSLTQHPSAALLAVDADDGNLVALFRALCRTATQELIFRHGHVAAPFLARVEALAPRVAGDATLEAWLAETRGFEQVSVTRDLARALTLFRRASAGFRAAGDARSALAQSVNTLCVLQDLGLYEACAMEAREDLAEAERMGLSRTISHTRSILAVALARSGQLDDALALAERADTELATHSDRFHAVQNLAYLAWLHHARGAGELAETYARRSLAAGDPMGLDFMTTPVAAWVLVARGKLAEAEALLARPSPVEPVLAADFVTPLRERAQIELALAQGHTDAAAALARAALARIDAEAACISDAALRRSFLEAVTQHREIRALAQRHRWLVA